MLCDVHWINLWAHLNDIPWNPDQLTTLYNIGYWTYPKLCPANLDFPHLSKRFVKRMLWHYFNLLDRIFKIAWFDLCLIAKCQLFSDLFPTLVRYQWEHLNIKKIYYWSIMVRATDSQISFNSSSHQKEDGRAHCDPAKERILYLYLPL